MIGAIATGRPDLAVVALPLAIGAAWSLRRRPDALPEVTVETSESRVGEGDSLTATVSVANPTGATLEPVVIGFSASRWLSLGDSDAGDRPLAAVLPDGQVADVALRPEALRWGRHRLGPAWARAAACDALLASPELTTAPAEVRVHPVTDTFKADAAMPRAAGLAGTHRSHRPGEGGELVGVRQFAPGDRLRRIDWRVSLRTRQLHVAATLSDREADVVLLLDTLHEAGESGGVRGAASALDVTVRGAAGVAEHYLHRGDRVSLLEFGPRHRQLRPASGRWQYQAVRDWLLETHVVTGVLDPAMWLSRPHLLPPNALVVAFTPLLDDRSAELLARLARAGRFLIAVDTLPADARPAIDSEWLEAATQFWRLARQNTIDELREHGVPVVAWRGSGSLDEVLRDVSRMALAAPR
ncbi:MAG: DUF58 domain-containing protein [Micromonosporaceae bacterium]|nr:DUF58 domain-containing protein [Micromonosporaceae bacterium]